MEFTYASPKEVGASAKQIKKYIEILEKYELSTHSVIMARGNKIFFEKYWEPFDKDFAHRLYSVTKSIVSLAIGFLIQDGMLSLQDKICDYFSDIVPDDVFENVKNQTIENMLMMSTGVGSKRGNWFANHNGDRLKCYFGFNSGEFKPGEHSKKPGSFFSYDSNGSFVLCALVEHITGKTFMEYMNERLFKELGISEHAHFLECPGGHTWGDSALLCTSLDLLKIARFTLNYGKIGDKQVLSEQYLRSATSCMITNSQFGMVSADSFGYGYQIWRTWNNSFFFSGMGCQYAVCNPEKDVILIYTGDNQANSYASSVIIDRFFEEIVDTMDTGFADEISEAELFDSVRDLKLQYQHGMYMTSAMDDVNGKTYKLNDNPMGIMEFKLQIHGDSGELYYKNAQGDKCLKFGIGKNIFGIFPEEGYSGKVGGITQAGNYYRCAASAAWIEERKFGIKVQIIDEYFGRLFIQFHFENDGSVSVMMSNFAENFLKTYSGYADGVLTN